MISVVMTYYNRLSQLVKVLNSLVFSSHKDFEVIIVDDGSNESNRIESVIANFPFRIRLERIEAKQKDWVNPCIPFNIGFRKAQGEKILIQNAECFHVGDILGFVENNLVSNRYMSFSCFSASQKLSKKIIDTEFENSIDIKQQMSKTISAYPQRTADGWGANNSWYNHPVVRPKAYHFASCIMKEDLNDLGGFDERYANGSGFDDDEFICRIRKKKMNVSIERFPYVIHLYHSSNKCHTGPLNKRLFSQTTLKESGWRVNV